MAHSLTGQRVETEQQHAGLLGMPPEMIQHVFSFVTRTDLPTLRLVSQEVGSQVFNLFASHYLHEIYCYFIDPARLQALQKIFSCPRLSGLVRKVVLTMDPYEGWYSEEASVAPPEGVTMQSDQLEAWSVYTAEQHRTFHTRPPSVQLLGEVLACIKGIGAAVGFDFDDTGQFCEHQAYFAEVWKLAVQAGCTITDLYFLDETDPDLKGMLKLCDGGLSDSLIYLRFDVRFNDVGKYNSVEAFRAFRHRLDSTTRLEELHIHVNSCSEHRKSLELQALEPEILHVARFRRLECLGLFGLHLDHEDLLRALKACRKKLTYLGLSDVHILTSTDAWTDVLLYARDTLLLEHAHIGPLRRSHGGGQQVVHTGTPDNQEHANFLKWECKGRGETRNGLTSILEGGLQYV